MEWGFQQEEEEGIWEVVRGEALLIDFLGTVAKQIPTAPAICRDLCLQDTILKEKLLRGQVVW